MPVSALRQQECNDYVAIGVNLMLTPSTSYGLALPQMTSPTGRSHTFDKRANGYARCEAVCAVARTIADDGTTVDGAAPKVELHGSAVRQDGRSASLTAPNGSAQRSLLLVALCRSVLAGRDVGTIEAHGTGTALGDPTEAAALVAHLADTVPSHSPGSRVRPPASLDDKALRNVAVSPSHGQTSFGLFAHSPALLFGRLTAAKTSVRTFAHAPAPLARANLHILRGRQLRSVPARRPHGCGWTVCPHKGRAAVAAAESESGQTILRDLVLSFVVPVHVLR